MCCDVARNEQINDDDRGWILGRFATSQSCKFSFLLGLITLTAAAGYKAVTRVGNYDGESPAGTCILGMFRGRGFGGTFSLLVGWIFKSKGTGYIRMVSYYYL